MSHKQINNIQKQFPELDLTQSVIGDVLTQTNNKKRAVEILREMKEEAEHEKEQKIKELQEQFTLLSREAIIEALVECKWDVEEAIIPLFTKVQEPVEDENRKQRDVDNKQRKVPVKDEQKEEKDNNEGKESPFKVESSESTKTSTESSNDKRVKMIVTPDIIDKDNKQIRVEWEMENGKSTSYDWIGMYNKNDKNDNNNKNYITYEWVNNNNNNNDKGYVTFNNSNNYNYGTYEYRYIPYGSYNYIGISNSIKIGPIIDIKAYHDIDTNKIHAKWIIKSSSSSSYSNNRSSWVGLYRKNDNNNRNWISWEYAHHPYTEVSFDSPIKPDDYEFRYFPYGYNDIARSNTITINGNDKLIAGFNDDNTRIIADISIVSVDPYYDSVWIGVYSKGETNNKNLKRYKWIRDRICKISFTSPSPPGDYEFRIFANKSYIPIITSSSFTVHPKN